MNRSSLTRSHTLRVALLAIATGLIFVVWTADAGAAASSCQPKGTKTIWKHGTARVYYKPDPKYPGSSLEGIVPSTCSSKFPRRYLLQPRADRASYFFNSFRWNGRYLYFTTEEIEPLTSGPRTPALIDLKTGFTTLKIPRLELLGTRKPVECGGGYYGCWHGAQGVALGPKRSFVIRTGFSPSGPGPATPARSEILLYCVNERFTKYTMRVIDDELAFGKHSYLKRDGNRATWISNGEKKSVKFC